jgi:hypothetical protein
VRIFETAISGCKEQFKKAKAAFKKNDSNPTKGKAKDNAPPIVDQSPPAWLQEWT